MNSFEFASVLLLAFGVYILYACVQLKVSGEPVKGVMVGSRVNLKNAKDMEGFKNYVFKKCLFVGIALVVLSLATVGFSFLESGRWLMIVTMLGLLAVCIYYTKMISYAQQTYILGLDVEALKQKKKAMKANRKAAKKEKKANK